MLLFELIGRIVGPGTMYLIFAYAEFYIHPRRVPYSRYRTVATLAILTANIALLVTLIFPHKIL